MDTFVLSHNSENDSDVIVTFCQHSHTTCHTNSDCERACCDRTVAMTMAATVTVILGRRGGKQANK